MWKYLSTGAPAFRNFRLVAPIDVDESKDLRREKDRIEADEYVFMYGTSRREERMHREHVQKGFR